MRGSAESIQNMSLKPSQTQLGTSQNLLKSRPGAALDAKKAPKRRNRPAKRRPRGSKTRPRAPKKRPKGPKRRPRVTKSHPKGAQEGPSTLQNRAWRGRRPVLNTIFVGSSVRKAPGPILYGLLASVQSSRYIKNLDFCRSCQCFVRFGAFVQCSFFLHAKASKNKPLGRPKPSRDLPKTLQNRAQSVPRRTKTSPERPKTVQDTQHARKKHPRAKNGANSPPKI